MRELVGPSLPKAGRKLLAQNVGLLVAKWEQLERQQEGTAGKKTMKKMKTGKQKASRTKKGKRGRR
jgi:hypothetical protein